jgi:hypothetical protein
MEERVAVLLSEKNSTTEIKTVYSIMQSRYIIVHFASLAITSNVLYIIAQDVHLHIKESKRKFKISNYNFKL